MIFSRHRFASGAAPPLLPHACMIQVAGPGAVPETRTAADVRNLKLTAL